MRWEREAGLGQSKIMDNTEGVKTWYKLSLICLKLRVKFSSILKFYSYIVLYFKPQYYIT